MNRAELEARLAEAISRELQKDFRALMDYLGDPPELLNVPPAFWQDGWQGLQQKAEPILMEVFLEAAQDQAVAFSFGVDWTLVNTDAARWARRHTEMIMREVYGTTNAEAAALIPRYFEEGWSIRDLRTRLQRWFGAARAQTIAITETTRAAVAGERYAIAELEAITGERMVPIWRTANDEKVCPYCGPRNGMEITDAMFPPAHPRCRCGVSYELPKKEAE
jgi:hypothetical protein